MPDPTRPRETAEAGDPTSALTGPAADATVAAPAEGPTVLRRAAPAFGPPAAPGEVGTLGRYRIVKLLGKGGMGAVYAAIDTRLHRRLALKVMLPEFAADAEARERFLREARAAGQVSHDNVVTVYEADERDGVPYIAMQFLQGMPLDEYLKKKGNPSTLQVLRIAREAALGLAAAHARGLVHRDIKPANLWLEAPEGRVKVLDFGLAKPTDGEVELTKSGAVYGTPAYMAPEQARGLKVDHRADLFSLGAVLYRLCTGRLPFDGPNAMAVMMALASEEPKPVRELNPAVPGPLAELIHQLLAKKPDARPQTADEVARRARAIALGTPAAGQPTTPDPAATASRPQVAAAQMHITAAEVNPFAELDAMEAETEAVDAAPAPPRTKAGGSLLWPAVGLAAVLLVTALGGWLILKNVRGTDPKPDPSAAGKGKDGKGPTAGGKRTAPEPSPDRKAAEWVLSVGGTVLVNGLTHPIKSAAELPRDGFILTAVSLHGNKSVTDADLARLRDCKELTHLNLALTPVTDAGLAYFKDSKKLGTIALNSTQLTDAGLAYFKDCKELTHLQLNETRVTDAGLAHVKDNCRDLTYLALNNTGVTDAGLAYFKDCKELTIVEVINTGVTGAGLIHLKGLAKLGHLALSGTKVTDAGLEHLKSLTGLTYLNLGGTAVTDAGLEHLKGLTGLRYIDARGAKVTEKGLREFQEAVPGCAIEWAGGVIAAIDVDRRAAEWVLSAGGAVGVNGEDRELRAAPDLPKDRFTLTKVSLDGRPVTDAGMALLRPCTGVTWLHLAGTEVTDDALANLAGMKSLWFLELGRTKVTDAGVAHIRPLASLGWINLSDTRITDAATESLQEIKTLFQVILNNTGVTDAGVARLAALPRLDLIHLAGTKVTDAGLAHFKDRTGLKYVGLADTAVTDAGLNHLKGHKQMRQMFLDRTAITDAGLGYFKECKELSEVTLTGTKVTADGLKEFGTAVPGCKIKWDGGVIEPRK